VFIVDSIKLSHRFAGPIFSLRRTIRAVAQGETPRPLKFRRRDFWHDLAEDYNAMLVRLGALEEQAGDEPQSEELVESKQ
jgi:nitrogen fixation/metabolism regulation signal transduction histidine kinase